jgi:uncharacterized protein YdeI (YjbR/CyaY-like superfamily)
MSVREELYVSGREEWREWLRRNHAGKREIWLVYYKQHTGRPRIPYDDAVEEALCFGWIDSIVRKIDGERFAQKFTPRTSKSRWSETNKARAVKMMKMRRMTEAGFRRIREAKESGEWFRAALPAGKLLVPAYIRKALEKNGRALRNFEKLTPSQRRLFVGWVSSAKREETRKERLAETIKLLEKGEKLGMK